MKTILKKGQRVAIPFCAGVSRQASVEGEAQLISLVRKSHTRGPAGDHWPVSAQQLISYK